MKIRVSSQGRTPRTPSAATVTKAARAMLHALELDEVELSIVLCDDRTIHGLNRDYRHKDRPTDVLAFAMREGEGAEFAGDLLGDVVISMQTAARQAAEHGHSLATEVYTLLAHGLLHLLGWDHRNDAEDRRMRREVARLVGVVPGAGPLGRTRMASAPRRKVT
jgi:probable rRNA maturation factor